MPLKPQAAFRKDINPGRPTLQHRHFAVIADIIRHLPRDFDAHGVRPLIAEQFADQLARTNVNFNRDRFLRAALAPVEG